MSHDLEIYLHSRPPLEVIHNCLQRQRLVTLSEQKAGTITEIVVSTSDKEHLGASSFSVRSAISLLPDDIPDISLPEFQKATWLVTVSTGLFDKFSIAAAEKFCIDLVKSIGGAVYEPSNELVIFPKNRKYFLKHTDSSKQLKLITISWFCDEKDFLPEKAGQLLECLDSMFPECRPNRFGDGGPYQSPIEDKSKESFVAACRSEMSDIGILTWRGRHPCIEGTIYMPTSNRVHLSNERSCVSIDITFDCSFFEQDEMRCEKLVRLFVSIAEQLECFYAGAYVNFGEGAEGFGSPRAWAGIPDVQTWLTWFGDASARELIAPCLNTQYVSLDGKFLKLGATPQSCDELQLIFPKLPERVINPDSGKWIRKPFNT